MSYHNHDPQDPSIPKRAVKPEPKLMTHDYTTTLETQVKENRMIAEFMQATNNYQYASDSLTYHSSWSALMPVVIKINAMKEYFCINIDQDTVCLHFSRLEEMQDFKFEDYGGTIQAVYKAVTVFIHWYNSQNKV